MIFCRPYIIDLDSINGTYLNNQRIEPRRFYELKEKVRILLLLLFQFIKKFNTCIVPMLTIPLSLRNAASYLLVNHTTQIWVTYSSITQPYIIFFISSPRWVFVILKPSLTSFPYKWRKMWFMIQKPSAKSNLSQ